MFGAVCPMIGCAHGEHEPRSCRREEADYAPTTFQLPPGSVYSVCSVVPPRYLVGYEPTLGIWVLELLWCLLLGFWGFRRPRSIRSSNRRGGRSNCHRCQASS